VFADIDAGSVYTGSSARSTSLGVVSVDESRKSKTLTAAAAAAAAVSASAAKSRQPQKQPLQGYYYLL